MRLKSCSRCKEEKPVSEFHRNTNSRDGLQSRCKPCAIRLAHEWAVNNRDRARANRRAVYAANRDVDLKRHREWHARNPGKDLEYGARYRAKNPERERQRAKLKRQKHAATSRAYLAKKRARIKQATPAWANAFFIAEAYRLAVLREKVTGVKWHVDHIVPLNSPLVCGLHTDANLRVITKAENLAKANRSWPDMP